ncbi:hypothetical protein GTQ99_15620 [Kineococcus sp. T13]|uniref:hypothetical protein n=1 Tax=Kineococcus vitellinus TaxID=2696565 RepID=UPI001413209A|nr:hypothetical protein [Kineococcus vitellinus]NAZ76836.1 hypothetical protein [Kineococcus vitellinus]
MGEFHDDTDEVSAHGTLETALAQGVTLFKTADAYGSRVTRLVTDLNNRAPEIHPETLTGAAFALEHLPATPTASTELASAQRRRSARGCPVNGSLAIADAPAHKATSRELSA